MKNKMILTALAVAMAAPGVAIADGHKGVKWSGIVQQHLFLDQAAEDSDPAVLGGDVRLQVLASETVGGVTGYGQYRLDAEKTSVTIKDTNGNTVGTAEIGKNGRSNTLVHSDNVRVGVKGDFGNVMMGESMEVDFGEYANDINTAQSISNESIAYAGSFANGQVKVETLYSPKGSDDEFAIGVEGNFGGIFTVGASTGTQKASNGVELANETKNTIFGGKVKTDYVTVAAHSWKKEVNAVESEGYAVKVSGKASVVSWGLTYDQVKDGTTTTRLDLGTKAAGLDLGLRYNNAKPDSGDSSDFLRLSAAKKF